MRCFTVSFSWKMKNEISQLEVQRVSLLTKYEQAFDLAAVKTSAQQAGMSQPSESQIYYIDLSDGDNAVVYQQTQPNVLSRVLTSVNHGIYTAVEYFK